MSRKAWKPAIRSPEISSTWSDHGAWNLFGPDHLLWSVPDEQIATVETPILVLQGDDAYHPKEASRELAARAPNASLIERWKEPADQPAARAAINEFLVEHAP